MAEREPQATAHEISSACDRLGKSRKGVTTYEHNAVGQIKRDMDVVLRAALAHAGVLRGISEHKPVLEVDRPAPALTTFVGIAIHINPTLPPGAVQLVDSTTGKQLAAFTIPNTP